MMQRKFVWLFVIAVLLYSLYWLGHRPDGIAIHESYDPHQDPLQDTLDGDGRQPILLDRSGFHWQVTPRAKYRIAARVLSRESYGSGWQSSLSPVDLALGWGKLSDRNVDQWIQWRQHDRWYFYEWREGIPVTNDYIVNHSSNVHILPSDKNLTYAVQALHRNEIVLLEGYLVDIAEKDKDSGYWWHTSLSRDDTGDGSCEILWLKRAVTDGKEYK